MMTAQTLFCTAHLLFTHIARSQTVVQSINLTPSNTGSLQEGATLMQSTAEVTTFDNLWSVNVKSQSGWQFIITLDDTYGFDPFIQSAITVTMNTPSIATDELLFGFTTDNENYVSMSIPMDSLGRSNQMYPACSRSLESTEAFAFGDVASMPNFDRNCDLAGGSCLNWVDMIPPNEVFSTTMSMTLILENDPAAGTLSIYFGSDQRCVFSSGFQAEQGLKIYIAGNNYGESYMVSSFLITSTIRDPTTSPTPEPSNEPTVSPTDNPTLHPTTPTANPTTNPTDQPTVSPTQSTANPTNIPTISPSITPSTSPTNVPTVYPSTNPTSSPSVVPTEVTISPTTDAPTVSPTTGTPTLNPTNSPSTVPSASPSNNPSATPTVSPSQDPTTAEPTRSPLPPGFVWGAYDQLCPVSATITGLCRDTMHVVSAGTILCLQPYDCCMCNLIECGYNGAPCREVRVGSFGAYGVKDVRISGAVAGSGATIDCQGNSACTDSAIVGDHVNFIDCDGKGSCANATMNISEPTIGFTLECSGIESCAGLHIEINFNEPPPGESCGAAGIFSIPKISCNNRFACEGLHITINNQGCDRILIENLECIQPNACNNAVFNLIGDVEIQNCQCGPSCSNTMGLTQCFVGLQRVLCPDPFSCAGQSKTITNPQPGFEFICSDVQSCEKADFVIEMTSDSVHPIDTLGKILFGGQYSAREATFTIDNQQPFDMSVGLIECGGSGSCVDTTFIIGTNVFIENIICATNACLGCTLRRTATGPGIPCDASNVRPLRFDKLKNAL